MSCDYDSDSAADMMSSCQQDVEDGVFDNIDDLVEENNDCCSGATTKRSLFEHPDGMLDTDSPLNLTSRYKAMSYALEHRKRGSNCPKTASTTLPALPAGKCVATYTCNYDLFPNVW